MECKFIEGQRVICARLPKEPYHKMVIAPTVGCVYTIAQLGMTSIGPRRGEVILFLKEIPSEYAALPGVRVGHAHWMFEPVRDTDISQFKEMLKTKLKEDELA